MDVQQVKNNALIALCIVLSVLVFTGKDIEPCSEAVAI